MSGRVVWTGRSSMDVSMELQQGGRTQLVALFTFVARDALTNAPQLVSPLALTSARDREVFDLRQARAEASRAARRRSVAQATGLHSQGLSTEALRWAGERLQAGRSLRALPGLTDPFAVASSATRLASSFICFPQQRNAYGRVFGGFLMRRAFELALQAAYQFSGRRPLLAKVHEIQFRKPVDVGNLCTYAATILHTWQSQRDPSKVGGGVGRGVGERG